MQRIIILLAWLLVTQDTLLDTNTGLIYKCSHPGVQLKIWDSVLYMIKPGPLNNTVRLKNYKKDYQRCFKDLEEMYINVTTKNS